MKRMLCFLAVGLLFAQVASADITPLSGPLQHRHLTLTENGTTIETTPSLGPSNLVYDNIAAGAAGYLAFPAAAGVVGQDDYDTSADTPFVLLESFQFVGGVAELPGGDLSFDIGGETFGVSLPEGGNFIWTITLTTPTLVADSGLFTASAVGGSTGVLFLSDGIPAVGTTVTGSAFTGDFDHNFALNGTAAIPEPTSVAILSIVGLGLVSRRRR
ncbi:MAG: PEP-CTERM sorting domain-containing protein [Planctomycetota bacterium]